MVNSVSSLLVISFSPVTAIVIAVVAFLAGVLFRSGLTGKQKKKVLKLEDEMLSNHSRILSLEKKLSELEQENRDLRNNNSSDNKKADLKIS